MSDNKRLGALRRVGLTGIFAFSGLIFLFPAVVSAQDDHSEDVVSASQVPSATLPEAAHSADQEHGHGAEDTHADAAQGHSRPTPSLFWIAPFVILLGCIALLPLIPATEHWWHKNTSKLLVALVLASITLGYYFTRDFGFPHGEHLTEPGIETVKAVLNHAVIADYIPFIVLLLSLFVISGGINVRGDVQAYPVTNTGIIALGGVLASFIGTTGAAMLLIRPLLQFNQERKNVVHTVVFFIFVVCNIGGCLLPIGDPPLFLGYLRGVPFLWTLHLVWEWAFCLISVLAVYYLWDSWAWKREPRSAINLDETFKEPVKITGGWNGFLLLGVVLAVALLVPGKKVPGIDWEVPHILPLGVREYVQLGLAGISLLFTSKAIRKANDFSFFAINEVACLFIGIFICMQAPIEILNAKGPELGLSTPVQFFWASGFLSSFLDNAPTYVVFFQTAGTLPWENTSELMSGVQTATGTVPIPLLVAISCGSVFMGAMTYIGNGPNFMVKSIAEQAGVRMPSFFGYMIYSVLILVPVYIALTFVLL
jgi:Na+/H+ antiporter NhaD/arsenite permease-like protein